MQIEILSNQTVKVILEKNDLKKFDIVYSQINKNSIKTQMMFIEIIEHISDETGIDYSEKNLYFELLPTKNSGCLIYISIDDENDVSNNEISNIYKFDDIDTIVRISKQSKELCTLFKCSSELYFCSTGFILILTFIRKYENFIRSMLVTLGEPVCSGNINSEYIREHFDCIAYESAIEKISSLVISRN